MRRVPAILFIALAACGSPPPLFGGFTPTNGAAVILAPATCNNIAFLGPTAISGILLELSSGSDACNVLTQSGPRGRSVILLRELCRRRAPCVRLMSRSVYACPRP